MHDYDYTFTKYILYIVKNKLISSFNLNSS